MANLETTPIRPWDNCDPAGTQRKVQDIVRITGLSRSSVYKLIAEGEMPPLIKLGKRASAMPASWLDAWVRDRASRTGR